MDRVIINRTKEFGTINNTIKTNDELWAFVRACLKVGRAHLIIDTDETVMYNCDPEPAIEHAATNIDHVRYSKIKKKNMLVVHPVDSSTDFLCAAYRNHDCNVIRERLDDSFLNAMILMHDTIVLMGHGTHQGLINTVSGGYAITQGHSKKLAHKNTFMIWCNADEYVRQSRFANNTRDIAYTGMIISEWQEANYCGVTTAKDYHIEESNLKLALMLNNAISSPPMHFTQYASAMYQPGDNPVMQFNSTNFYVKANKITSNP